MKAVVGKELGSYFTSLLAYVVIALFLGASGFYFYSNLSFFLLSGGFDMTRGLWQYQFHDMRQVMLTLLPLLTMRLFAEERRLGTLELLWTYPLRDVEIVLGKYVASLIVLALMLVATLLYPLLLVPTHATIAAAPLAAGYLGLFLLGAAFLACGILVSALTDSQVLAAAITFTLLLLFWMMTWNEAAVGAPVLWLLSGVSLFDRFYTFARGGIDTRDVVFLVLFSVVFLGWTLLALGSRRWRGVR
ncbi:MAG TPA: ABC transporter permease subunit [Candidatus Bathyarchaeia archaeon]|nr:ABC transporter permease subunit [Candidatus Bathyarchaeia archaeon]